MGGLSEHRVTASDIARALGLSQTTVSLVLAGQAGRHRISAATVERVLETARAMNYRPNPVARQLAGKRSNVVAVLISTEAVADVRLLQLMEIMAAERGIRFIVGHALGTGDQVKAYLDDFRARGVDAVISIFHNHPDYSEAVLPELARFRNVVCFERPTDAHGIILAHACYVQPDYYEVGRLGVQHLLDRGRRRIGLVFSNLVFPYAVQRRRAAEDTLRAAGQDLTDDRLWILDRDAGVPWTEPFGIDRAMAAVDKVVVAGGADAVVAVNDLYAARIVQALRKRGRRVPDDVAVVGCDNLEVGTLIDPPLTTLDLRVVDLSRTMMSFLFTLLDDGLPPEEMRSRVLKPELVIRESS